VSGDYLESVFGLAGKVAIVTGGNGLIGSGLCRGLASAGAGVAVLGRRLDACEEVARQIEAGGGRALGVGADVLDVGQLDAARERIVGHFGRIDILVNCVGGSPSPAARVLPDQPLFNAAFREATRLVVDMNLVASVNSTFAFGDAIAVAGGVVVNISSAAATHVSPGVMGYSAAKAGLEQLTRWLAVEAAHRYGGRMRVNAIAPGYVVGGKNRPRFIKDDGTLTELGADVQAHIPAGRFGSPEDLVPALLMLCSPASGYVTGVIVSVNGGFALAPGV
jgi:NAD(P)-dependent dehydrogenase (short-subunit alcohol dehydrogenase family)